MAGHHHNQQDFETLVHSLSLSQYWLLCVILPLPDCMHLFDVGPLSSFVYSAILTRNMKEKHSFLNSQAKSKFTTNFDNYSILSSKAGYTATQVACWWTEAAMKMTNHAFGPKKQIVMDQPTNRPSDRQT